MHNVVDVFYLTLPVDNADQAVSLAEYLNHHGVCAAREGNDAVICPIDHPDKAGIVHQVRQTWRMYWDNHDSGLFGLPVFTRENACPTCGV